MMDFASPMGAGESTIIVSEAGTSIRMAEIMHSALSFPEHQEYRG